MLDGCYCTECLTKIGLDKNEREGFILDGFCPRCRERDKLWPLRRQANPSLPEGWRPELNQEVIYLLDCLLAQAGISVGDHTGRAILGAVTTIEGLWVETSDGIVQLTATEVLHANQKDRQETGR
jgi:hypothetical protein